MSERRTVGRKPSPEIDLARDVGHSSPLASTISAVSFEGLTITSPDGEPATLAVVDRDGRIVESGPGVVDAVWSISIRSYRNFLKGHGYLRVLAKPTGIFHGVEDVAHQPARELE
jgi:hypothetical protein